MGVGNRILSRRSSMCVCVGCGRKECGLTDRLIDSGVIVLWWGLAEIIFFEEEERLFVKLWG